MGFGGASSSVLTSVYFLVLLTLLPLIGLFVVIPVFLSRLFVYACSRAFGPVGVAGMIGQLCGLHAVDDLSGKPLGNLLVALYLEDRLDLPTLQANFLHNVLEKRKAGGGWQYPELRQTVCHFMGYSFWRWVPDFEATMAADHCKVYTAQEGEVLDEARLLQIRQALVLKPWKAGRPPWEAVIVEAADGGTVLFFLAHHILMDGYSVINILVEDFSSLNLEKVIAAPAGWGGRAVGALRALSFPIKALYEFSGELCRGTDYNDWHSPDLPLNRTGSFSYANSVSVNYIKEIKNAHGVSFTAVLLSAICSAIRNGMKGEGLRVPDYVDSFTVFPMPGHPKKLTNHLSHALIRLPTGNPDSRSRLVEIDNTIQRMKGSTIPVLNFFLSRFLGQLPCSIIRRLIRQKFPATLAISNFPAPNVKVRVQGTTVHRVEFEAGPMLAIPLGFACLTYNGKACIFAGVDSAISGYERISRSLIEHFEEELDILHQASTP